MTLVCIIQSGISVGDFNLYIMARNSVKLYQTAKHDWKGVNVIKTVLW